MRVLQHPQAVADWLHERVRGELQCDSRRVHAGDAFVAWPGFATDGRRFVAPALEAGASAVLVERDGVEAFGFEDDRVTAVPSLKAQAGHIASAFHGHPSAALDVVAVTGTNGKTSTAWWMAQLLSAVGRPCAVVGTLGIGQPPVAGDSAHPIVSTGLTTPDPVLLQARLRAMVDGGMKACAIEASSIGLIEGRLNATQIRVAVFTNFTQDHLDFHGSMADYWAAKAALFDWPGLACAVVNVDDPQGAALARQLEGKGLDLWTIGVQTGANAVPCRLGACDIGVTERGMRLVVVERGADGAERERHGLSLPLIGRYNLSNLLCVLAAARALGVPLVEAVNACSALTPVPGRMEQVVVDGNGPLVLVDYAHTPDALEKALRALQPLAQARGGSVWAVAGCGGDRDAGKRPLMAAVAEREARHVVLTSDNPRSEDPQAILTQMVRGLSHPERALVEVDRAQAIERVVQQAAAQDVVLIAGKGHEDYQEVQGVKRPFSDRVQARSALQQRSQSLGVSA